MTNPNPGAAGTDPIATSVGTPHSPAGDTEEVYYEGTPVLRGEIGRGLMWILLGLLIIAGVIFFQVKSRTGWPNLWAPAGLAAVGLILICVPFVRAKTVKYRITNYRIDLQRGLLSTNIDTLELWHVEDIRFHQSLLDKILGIGNITILSKHPTLPLLAMRSLPDARSLFTTLEQRVIAVKRQAGVMKVDTGT